MSSPKIYTKTGDKGRTSLVGGSKVAKTDARLDSYGTVDELNSFVGVLRSEIQKDSELHAAKAPYLETLQNLLFNIGSQLACEDPVLREKLPPVTEKAVTELEAQIDKLQAELAPLKQFILPGGTTAAALAHVCRSVCRRAERVTCEVMNQHEVPGPIPVFLNRLSDYFFVLARWLCLKTNTPDQLWTKDPDGHL